MDFWLHPHTGKGNSRRKLGRPGAGQVPKAAYR